MLGGGGGRGNSPLSCPQKLSPAGGPTTPKLLYGHHWALLSYSDQDQRQKVWGPSR